MTRLEIPAVAAAIVLTFFGGQAWADTDPSMSTPFEDGTFLSVDDAELAGEFGRGLVRYSTLDGGGLENRWAVILWDETKRPITPNGSFGGVEQAGASVVINVGNGSTPNL